MKFLAVVTARKGSKTIKNKNIKKIGKKSLVEYTFEELNKTSIKNKYVLTDSTDIKNIAKKYNINTDYVRPKNLSKDKTSSIDTISHFSDWYLKKSDYDALIMLQPTSPLRVKDDILNSVKSFKKKKYHSLFSVSKSLEHPYETIDLKNKNEIYYVFKKSSKFYRRQDYKINSYFINGAIYIVKKDLIKKKQMYSKKNHGFYIMPKIRSFDLDDIEDFEIAKKLLK